MPVIEIPPVVMLAPVFLIGAYIGFRRGWKRETFTAIGIAVILIVLRRGLEDILWLINGVLDRLSRVASVLAGQEPRTPPWQLVIGREIEPLLVVLVLMLLVALVYVAGNYLLRMKPDRLSRLFGAIVGGINLSLIAARLISDLRPIGAAPGSTEGVVLRIPAFPGANIVMAPPPEGALLVGWPVAALGFLVVATLVYLLLRMARA